MPWRENCHQTARHNEAFLSSLSLVVVAPAVVEQAAVAQLPLIYGALNPQSLHGPLLVDL